jgi:hypothetical protein
MLAKQARLNTISIAGIIFDLLAGFIGRVAEDIFVAFDDVGAGVGGGHPVHGERGEISLMPEDSSIIHPTFARAHLQNGAGDSASLNAAGVKQRLRLLQRCQRGRRR